MATIPQIGVRQASPGGKIRHFPEKASGAYKKFEMVYVDSTGRLVVCADGATACKGMALADATGTVDTMMPVLLAGPEQTFEVNCFHVTPASAVTAITQRTKRYAYENDSNKGYVDIGDTDNDFWEVVDLARDDEVGDLNGRLIVKVLDAVYQAES